MIIDRYILKNHFFPFIFSNFIIISVLLLQYLMKHADMLIGKGLSYWVIGKFIVYNLGHLTVLAVPMSALISTLMAFGNMAQNNEIAIFKASGVSLYRMLVFPIIASVVLAYLLVQFNNYVYPQMNYTAKVLRADIAQQKPTLSLVPGVFSQDVPYYAIMFREEDQKNEILYDVIVFDYSNAEVLNIIKAKEGKIYFSKDRKRLILDLKNGEIHQSDNIYKVKYRKLIFENHRIAMHAEQFSFQETIAGERRSERELGAQELLVDVAVIDSVGLIYKKDLTEKIIVSMLIKNSYPVEMERGNLDDTRSFVYLKVRENLIATQNSIKSTIQLIQNNKNLSNEYWVEVHKRYSLPVACIIFVLIGAPLGTMIRRGGIGIAAGVSLFFFLIYWIFLIGGEKLADRGLLSPFWSMWSANILLGVLGIILIIKCAKETVTLNFDFLKKLLPKRFRVESSENENT
ncbi:MAG: LptF/LptG family permease [Ignavibacteriales bacterium]|nr:LptF/LptG family permease [Ignavibacteriales bacterium]